jgi:tetratricopeptide (TPR) repeat protein
MFRISRGIDAEALNAETSYSRQHVFRIRQGKNEPSRDFMAAMVSAMRRLSLEDVGADDLFELSVEESGPWAPAPERQMVDRPAVTREAHQRALAAVRELPANGAVALAALRASPSGPGAPTIRALIVEGRKLREAGGIARAEQLFATAAALIDDTEDVRGDYRAFLKGTALVEQANALRHLGNYSEALPVLDRADASLEGIPSCTHELGRAWFTRGTLLFKMDRLDEATQWLRRAVNIFAAVTDARRVARVRLVEANVLYEQHRVEEACALWRTTLPVFAAARDRRTEAIVWMNLGWCGLDQDRADEAKRWLEKAVVCFETGKHFSDLARARWGLALHEARYGHREKGLARLEEQRDAFQRLGQQTDAATTALDIAETLLLPPARVRDARAVLRQIVPTFRAAGANREMLRALAYLAEAARHERATPALVRFVRASLRRASHDASFRFVPPKVPEEAGQSPASQDMQRDG